jgi:hypothetical protein
VSSLLKGGSSHTELALAMREFSLVGKWVEGRWVLLQTIITTAERKLYFSTFFCLYFVMVKERFLFA